MIKVRFIKDKVHEPNGKLIKKGKVIVLSAEYADKCINDGYAVEYNKKDSNEIQDILSVASKPKKGKRGQNNLIENGKD